MEDAQPSTSPKMRLKNDMLGPISVVQHNGNENLLSPENSTSSTTTATTTNLYSNQNSDNYNLTHANTEVDTLSNNRQNNQINQNNIENNQQQLNNLLSGRRFVDNGDQTNQRRQDTLQWCNSINTIQYQKQQQQQPLVTNNSPNNISTEAVYQSGKHPQLFKNINNTLAASLRSAPAHTKQQEPPRSHSRGIRSIRSTGASSVCSESSPDDSLLDYEEAHQSCSSVDTSPQDEDRGFDLSDTESLSDVENISGDNNHLQSRGIVNPNYPGFQHLAHTLDYTIKVCSDTDFTDDDLDLDETATKLNTCDVNNINNNNNNEDIEYKIDSVNRLDSVENIQKVFYDKPKLNIPLEFDAIDASEKQNNLVASNLVDSSNEEAEGSASNSSLEDFEGNIQDSENSDRESNENLDLRLQTASNINETVETVAQEETPLQSEDNLGELPNQTQIQTVEESQGPDQKSNNNLELKLNIPESISTADIIGNFGAELEQEIGRIVSREVDQRVEHELEEAVEKLTVANDLSPSALKYNIEPNSSEPFEKARAVQIETVKVLEPLVVQQELQPSTTDSKDTTEEEEKLHTPLIPVILKHQIVEDDEGIELQDLQPKLVKEMAEIKVARVCSTEALTLKMNQPFLQKSEMLHSKENIKTKTADAFLSEVRDDLPDLKLDKILHPKDENLKENYEKMEVEDVKQEKPRRDSNRELEETTKASTRMVVEEIEKYCKEEKTKDDIEKDEDSTVPRKKEKMEINYVKKRRDSSQQIASLITIPRRELGSRTRDNLANRRSVPAAREKKKMNPEILGGFDVYNIETAMPKIDLDAIESHLRAAREEERRRRTDREEIRRRLAMGNEDDYYNGCDRPGRKPSLQARLQSGMNLQICFMNETASDTESPSSDSESPVTEKFTSLPTKHSSHNQLNHKITSNQKPSHQPRPVSLPLGSTQPLLQPFTQPMTEADFFARQARLQTEARMALAQAKEMAHMQMEVERQRQKKSPITEMIRSSLEKVGIPFPEERRRVSRQILTEMNVAQLQVIVNDLHTQIETLNENLVRYLMNRDDLHMEQDSMLVDIEDLTRYLGAKEQTVKEQKPTQNNNIPPPSPAPASPLSAINNSVRPRLHRIASLVKK